MKTGRLLVLFALALLGYGGLFFLFPKTNPAAGWKFEMDRAAAVDKAKAIAPSFGYTATGQTESVSMEYNRSIEYYLAKQSNPLLGSLLSPLTTRVRLNDGRFGIGFEAWMNSRGDLIRYRRRERSTRSSKPDQPSQPSQPADTRGDFSEDQRVAEEALRRISGDQFGKFSFLAGSNSGKEDRKFSWSASDDRIRVLADVTVRNGQVRDLWLQPNLTPKFQAEFDSQRSGALKVLSATDGVLIWPAIILVIILYFVGLARRQIDHRKTLVFLGLCFLLLFAGNLLGSFVDGFQTNSSFTSSSIPRWVEVAFFWVLFGIVNLSIALSIYLFLASGLSLSIGLPNRRTVDLELLLKGKLLRRPVTGSIVAGLLAGGMLALIPHAIAAIGIFNNAAINGSGLDDAFTAKYPAFNALLDGSQFMIFLTFAFLIPCVDAFVKRRWVAQILVLVTAFLSLTSLDSFYTSAPALAVAGLLQAYLLVSIYRNFGLLAVIVSSMATPLAISSAALMAQASPSLQSSGWRALIVLGGALVVALAGLRASSEPKEEEVRVEGRKESRAERERLQAEFSVAQRAQQHMLPDAPPDVPGIAISAACHPSREVGGDLYDFLALPGGKVAVVVADVSGKGVPASLYMTLTKGLLDSVAEHETDPGEILREVNRHLYEVCRRKTFVTMFLGVIDPSRKTLTYARAGHNPTVIHRPSEQQTWMLKSRGMGLGLNSGKIFDQSLRVEILELRPRDKLFFYSDGITEAMNFKNEEYGEERLMATAASTNGLNAEQSRDIVLTDVTEFLGSVQPQDDQTLVVVQVL